MGPLKGAVLAQKALQGSKIETRELLGGTKENNVVAFEADLSNTTFFYPNAQYFQRGLNNPQHQYQYSRRV